MTDTPKDEWVTRFGVLESLIVRKTAKGQPYCTFTLGCTGFTQTGSAFGADLVNSLSALQDQKVNLFGVLEWRTLGADQGGRKVRSFKATKITQRARVAA